MKIAILHFGVIDGSSYSRSFLLGQNLSDLGHNVTLVATSDKNRLLIEYISSGELKIVAFPYFFSKKLASGGFGILTSIMKMFFLISNKFVIIQTSSVHRPSCWIPAYFASMLKGTIHIAEWWDNYGKGGHFDRKKGLHKYTLGLYDLLTEKTARAQADGIIALSSVTFNRAINLGFKMEEILILHGGADTKYINFISNFEKRKQFNLIGYDLIFGLVGMNSDEILDNLPLIQAVKALDEKYNIAIFTTGKKLSDGLKTKLQLNKNFIEFGWVNYDNLSDLLSCANAFALLQRDDLQSRSRWPNKSGDYFAAGRPIIINPVGEIASLMNENFPFIFWSQRDENEIKKEIVKLLSMSEEEIFLLGLKARKYAEDVVSWSSKSKLLLEFYKTF